MKVNFNNVRLQACNAYEKLVQTLNESTDKELGRIELHVNDVQEAMDDLRMMIGTIAATYEPDNPGFKDVYEERYPGESTMTCFNNGDEQTNPQLCKPSIR